MDRVIFNKDLLKPVTTVDDILREREVAEIQKHLMEIQAQSFYGTVTNCTSTTTSFSMEDMLKAVESVTNAIAESHSILLDSGLDLDIEYPLTRNDLHLAMRRNNMPEDQIERSFPISKKISIEGCEKYITYKYVIFSDLAKVGTKYGM